MPEFLSLPPACTGCRCVPHAPGREAFISLWKSCEKACRDGLLAPLLSLHGASPALGLKGVCQRVTTPFIGSGCRYRFRRGARHRSSSSQYSAD